MPNETTPSGSFNAVNAMMGLLSADEQSQETKDDQAKTDDDKAAIEGADVPDDEAETDSDVVEGDEAPPPAKTFKVKIDGEEIEVPESELLQGYSRTQDYTRKTQALAAERRKAEAEYEAVRGEREQYRQTLAQLAAKLEAAPEVDERLRQTDPIAYAQQLSDAMQHERNKQVVAQEQARIEALQKQEQSAALQKYLAQQSEQLDSLIPEWKDEKVAKAEKAKVRETAKAYGYSDDELAELYDARAVALMRDAMRYRELVAKRQEVKPKAGPVVQSRPKTVSNERTQLKQRLAQTGSVKDAAAYFLKTL